MAQYWGSRVWGCRVRRTQPVLTWPRIRLPLVSPQGVQDKVLTPENSLQAILALILSYLSLSSLPSPPGGQDLCLFPLLHCLCTQRN